MRICGATEYALLLYRDKLPKFRNGLQFDKDGKKIPKTGKMIFNWFECLREIYTQAKEQMLNDLELQMRIG